MFSFITNWRRRRARTRGLFSFHDGRRERRLDADAILRKLRTHPTFEMARHVKYLREEGPIGDDARRETLQAVQDAFGVIPFDDLRNRGLSEMEMWRLFDDYMEFLTSVKKNSEEPPTSPKPMDESPFVSPPKQSLDSNSMPIESCSGEPINSSPPSG